LVVAVVSGPTLTMDSITWKVASDVLSLSISLLTAAVVSGPWTTLPERWPVMSCPCPSHCCFCCVIRPMDYITSKGPVMSCPCPSHCWLLLWYQAHGLHYLKGGQWCPVLVHLTAVCCCGIMPQGLHYLKGGPMPCPCPSHCWLLLWYQAHGLHYLKGGQWCLVLLTVDCCCGTVSGPNFNHGLHYLKGGQWCPVLVFLTVAVAVASCPWTTLPERWPVMSCPSHCWLLLWYQGPTVTMD
jgi:hypothetical protein